MSDERQQGSESWYEPESGTLVINDTSVPTGEAWTALQEQSPEVAALVRWGNSISSRGTSLFERDRYVTPENIYQQFQTAYTAAQMDDVVAGVLETSDGLALGALDFEADEEDEADVWNQISEDIDLDARLREMWRELFTVSQFYCVTWWGVKTYRVRGKSDKGTKRKKSYRVRCPIGMSLLDPLKIIPVGNLMFGQERLAYMATATESDSFQNVLAGENTSDLFVKNVIESWYEPDDRERAHIAQMGVDPSHLWLLSDKFVWRHTETRAAYERFAPVRMKSVFELLDLKHQLRSMDRAHLIGGTNFIILVKKGSDEIPAKPSEIAQLAGQVRQSSRTPVIVGDHRLEIEIITPKNDFTLKPERYNAIDARLEARLFGMFMTGNYAAGAKGDDSIKLAKVVSKGLERRRDGLIRAVTRHVIKPTMKRNEKVLESDHVSAYFHPKHVALDLDAALLALLQDLRDRGDLSRESILDEAGFDQSDEAMKRQREKQRYDRIFTPTNVPFDGQQKNGPASARLPQAQGPQGTGPMGAPGGGAKPPGGGGGSQPRGSRPMLDPKAAGRRRGGNRNGGGANPDSKRSNQTPLRP